MGEQGTPPSLDRYLYAYSNPTMYWDPFGNKVLKGFSDFFEYDPGRYKEGMHKYVDEEQANELLKGTGYENTKDLDLRYHICQSILRELGINENNAAKATLLTVEPRRGVKAGVRSELLTYLGTGFVKEYNSNKDLKQIIDQVISNAEVGQIINITNFSMISSALTEARTEKTLEPTDRMMESALQEQLRRPMGMSENFGNALAGAALARMFSKNIAKSSDPEAADSDRQDAKVSLGIDVALLVTPAILSVGKRGIQALRIARYESAGSGTFNNIMQQVAKVEVSTPRNGAVFWTGYEQGNQAEAIKWAAANGKYTIEMTPGGQWLTSLDLYGPNSPLTRAQADAAWLRMSERFTEGASGHVTAFTRGTSYNPNSTFYGTELPGLRVNPNVNPKITYRGY